MTAPDTSTAAVERIALVVEKWPSTTARDTLRALAAERDALHQQLERIKCHTEAQQGALFDARVPVTGAPRPDLKAMADQFGDMADRSEDLPPPIFDNPIQPLAVIAMFAVMGLMLWALLT